MLNDLRAINGADTILYKAADTTALLGVNVARDSRSFGGELAGMGNYGLRAAEAVGGRANPRCWTR